MLNFRIELCTIFLPHIHGDWRHFDNEAVSQEGVDNPELAFHAIGVVHVDMFNVDLLVSVSGVLALGWPEVVGLEEVFRLPWVGLFDQRKDGVPS